MISSARIKKVEEKIARIERIEEEKNYQYIFRTSTDFEEAKRQGRVNPHGNSSIIILDE